MEEEKEKEEETVTAVWDIRASVKESDPSHS